MNVNRSDLNIGGLVLNNRILTAAGTVGFGSSYSDYFDLDSLGGLVLRTLTCEQRLGNIAPRLWETSSGMLNSIGMENPGLETFKKGYYPNLEKINTNIIASIFGETIDEFKILTEELSSLNKINALEVNLFISYDNYQKYRMEGYLNWAEEAIREVKNLTDLPIWVKLSPNVGDVEAVALLAEKEGASAIVAANTYWGMAINPESGESRLGTLIGGLSGAAIKPLALRLLWQLKEKVDIPIIGVGGILTLEDAIEFIRVGASAIGIGSANFVDPTTVKNIIDGLEKYIETQNIDDIIGKAFANG